MKLKIKEGSENYTCVVVQISELFPIEGADRIQRAVVNSENIIVSKDVVIGNRMLYFESGTKLNESFCAWNNLLDKAELNKDQTKGYISYKKLRVKSVTLKKVVSNGLLIPVSSLNLLPDYAMWEHHLKVGDSFTTINDFELCEKYIVPENTHISQGSGKQEKKPKLTELLIDKQFNFHFNTPHFKYHIDNLEEDDVVTISRKRHGSSGIVANVLVIKQLSWFEKLLLKLKINVETKEYGYIWSSGKPKSNIPKGAESKTNQWKTSNQSYYSEDIWKRAYLTLREKVEKGITLYFEITGIGIQGSDYTYGSDYEIHVYRITSTNVDGQVFEYSWEQLKEYCLKYGIKFCEEYFNGKVKELTTLDKFMEYCQKQYLNKSYPDCKVDEGVCIRKGNEIYKLKSPNFILGESNRQEEGIVEAES